ncbi:uncharacterized protein LOC120086353 [Benincasa hispida]|uniref:uncharacterized protein LOC120086353 n=1 Tax=Benincasa hispida TaxID=102211 RepID=UPI0018FFEA20|nr:uncharacterized protein LOC120086353 [Benincasa hispida]
MSFSNLAKVSFKLLHHFVMCGEEDKIEEEWRTSPLSLCPRRCHVSQSCDYDVPSVQQYGKGPTGVTIFPIGDLSPEISIPIDGTTLNKSLNYVQFPSPKFVKNEERVALLICVPRQWKKCGQKGHSFSGPHGEGTLGNSHVSCLDK